MGENKIQEQFLKFHIKKIVGIIKMNFKQWFLIFGIASTMVTRTMIVFATYLVFLYSGVYELVTYSFIFISLFYIGQDFLITLLDE